MTGGRAPLMLALLLFAACAPRVQEMSPVNGAPRLLEDKFVTTDGAVLPMRRWMPEDAPKAVFVAAHGFNDHSGAFAAPAKRWAGAGIATYAYDQRGFGAAPHPGIWAGAAILIADLKAVTATIRARHPGVPVYLIGESMGGAVVMLALTDLDPPTVEGAVLIAPAVWGRRHMNPIQRGALWLFAHSVPWITLTGQGLRIRASDNIEMLKALAKDPLFIKATRIDAIWGLANLMDAALDSAGRLKGTMLVVYGYKDEIIPKEPVHNMLKRLPANGRARIAFYPSAYHMLLRDLGAGSGDR